MNRKLRIVLVLIAVFIATFLLGTKVYAISGSTVNGLTRIRRSASTDSEAIAVMAKGQEVEVVKEDGEWYKIKYVSENDGTFVGYVRKDMLKVDEDTNSEKKSENTTEKTKSTENIENTESKENSENSVNTENTENQENTETVANDTTETKTIVESATFKLNKDIDIKLLPLVYSCKIGNISKDSEINIEETVGNWCHIQSENADGWIVKNKLYDSIVENTANNEKQEQDNKDNNNEKEDKEVSQKEMTMYVSTTTLNVRKDANTSSSLVVQLKLNDKVKVVETVDNTWSKIKYNNYTGYVATKYLSNDKAEITSRSTETTRDLEENLDNSSSNSNNEKKNSSESSNSSKKSSSSKSSNSSKESSSSDSKKSSSSSTSGSNVVAYAKKFLGNPYVWGGTSLTNGCDCSGFVMSVYSHFGYSLPHSSSALAEVGTAVSKSDLQVGDIVCFTGHVGIYIGGNKMIHASTPKTGIIISSLSERYYASKYKCARRVIK